MLFTVSFAQPQSTVENYLISGSTWSECLAYCEGTGKPINSITLCSDILVPTNTSLNYSFVFGLRDNVTGDRMVYQVFDTESNVLNWVISQTDKSLISLTKQNKQLVII
jgi:hypothetical protein